MKHTGKLCDWTGVKCMRNVTESQWRSWRILPILFCLLMVCQSAFAATKPSGALKDVEAATQDARHGIYTLYPGMPLEEYIHNWGNIKGWEISESHAQRKGYAPSDLYGVIRSRDHDHAAQVQANFQNKKLKHGMVFFYFRSKKEAEQAFAIADRNLRKAWGEPVYDKDHWNHPTANHQSHLEAWIQYEQEGGYNLSIHPKYRRKFDANGQHSTKEIERGMTPAARLASSLPYVVSMAIRADSEEQLRKEYDKLVAEMAKENVKPTPRKTTTHKIH